MPDQRVLWYRRGSLRVRRRRPLRENHQTLADFWLALPAHGRSLELVGSELTMRRLLEKTARYRAVALAGLFVAISLGGIFGVWFVNRKATGSCSRGLDSSKSASEW